MGIFMGSKPGVLDAICSAHPGSVKVRGKRGREPPLTLQLCHCYVWCL